MAEFRFSAQIKIFQKFFCFDETNFTVAIF